jgi:hypothetical protein
MRMIASTTIKRIATNLQALRGRPRAILRALTGPPA